MMLEFEEKEAIYQQGYRAGYQAALEREPVKMIVTTQDLQKIKGKFDAT